MLSHVDVIVTMDTFIRRALQQSKTVLFGAIANVQVTFVPASFLGVFLMIYCGHFLIVRD